MFKDSQNVKDRAFHQMLQRKGIKSIYNVPIKTLNGKIIGILGVDYVKHQMKDFDDPEKTKDFHD